MKWLNKLKWWRSAEKDYVTLDYGRYVHKPITGFALCRVMGCAPEDLTHLVEATEVYLNDTSLGLIHLPRRLEAGDYQLKIPFQNRIWKFYIL